MNASRPLRGAAPRLIAAVALVLPLLMDGGVASYGIGSPRGPEAVLLSERFTAGRLTGQRWWEPCDAVPGEALVPRVRCTRWVPRNTRHYAHLSNAAADLLSRLRGTDSTRILRAQGLWSLRRGDANRAVAALERAAALAPNDAGVLNDLAVANLEKGMREQSLEPMLRALDAAERAVARDSLKVEALYTRAVIAERLYLPNTARQAWMRYAAAEPDPRWRAEARGRAAALAPRAGPSWQAMVDGSAAPAGRRRARLIAARVRRDPVGAREFSFTLLGRWGDAVQRGKAGDAARLLAWAGDIGAAFREPGGDQTVPLAVGAIRAATGDRARTRELAEAHALLGNGLSQYRRQEYGGAAETLRDAEARLEKARSPMAGWAAYFRAAAYISDARYPVADTTLGHALSLADRTQPALKGRATWALGTSYVRRGLPDEAIRKYRAAWPYVVTAREAEYQGMVHMLLSESLFLAGQNKPSQGEAFQGLRALSSFDQSPYYSTQLTNVALVARRMALDHAALAIMNEKVALARAASSATRAQALRARARVRLALGDSAGAWADATQAARAADSIPPGPSRDRVAADVQVALAEVEVLRDPRAALTRMESVIRTYRAHQLGVYLPDALTLAAAAARALGDLKTARLHLRDAVEWIETLQDSMQSAESRASRLETLESAFDAAIGVELELGDEEAAFTYLERARLAAWPRDGRGARPESVSLPRLAPKRLARDIPPGTVLLEYAVLPDRLVLWTVSRRGIRHFVAPVGRDSLARLVTGFARNGYRSSSVDDAGATLAGLLLRPVRGELRRGQHLAIVPDRELNQVPFAALPDGRARMPVVTDFAISTLPSAAFYLAARGRRRVPAPRAGPALVVGEPATDPALGLDPLPAAMREALEIARLRAPATLLVGAEARRDSVRRLLPRTSLFHFAGHAVFNADQPELSYLALAPDSTGGTGVLHAWEIGQLAATNLMTVVLSACSTLSPRPTHAGAPAGLAYSFLRAGAPATVSTLWDVNDQTTTGVLVEFHRRVAAGTPAAEALRQAQVAALQSSTPATRSPVAWAAFIYTGP